MERFAEVIGARDADQVRAYLPSNYRVVDCDVDLQVGRYALVVLIAGTDVAGWSLDDYVVPRLASGLMYAQELKEGESV